MQASDKSRTQKKKEDRALQKLGEQLVALPADPLDKMELPQELYEAVVLARKIRQHGALRRQLQYIGTLMRKIDVAPIRAAMERIRYENAQGRYLFKKMEAWRDGLADGRWDMAEEILHQFPVTERQRLMQLARNAHKEKQIGSGSKSSRALFRYLREVMTTGQPEMEPPD